MIVHALMESFANPVLLKSIALKCMAAAVDAMGMSLQVKNMQLTSYIYTWRWNKKQICDLYGRTHNCKSSYLITQVGKTQLTRGSGMTACIGMTALRSATS